VGSEGAVQLALPIDIPTPNRIGGIRSRYADIAEYLRRHPGEWRQIAYRPSVRSAVYLVRDIRRGHPKCLAGMEARTARGFEVWARCPVMNDGVT
jgi:hypothetical protein